MKKIIALLLTVCMFGTVLTGCSEKVTVEGLLEKANTQVTEAKSVDSTLDLDLELGVDYSGMTMSMGISGDLDIQAHKESDSAYMNGELELNVLGMTQAVNVESYAVKDGDKYISYSSNEEGVWTYEEVEEPQGLTEQLNVFNYASQNIEAFKLLEETATFNEKECYVVEGTLKGDQLKDILSSVNTEDMLGSDAELDLSEMYLNLTCYFEKETQAPVGIELEIPEEFKVPTEGEEGSLSIKTLAISVVYNSFDKVEEIKVPQEVKDAATEDAGDEDIMDDPEIIIPENPVDTEAPVDDEEDDFIEGDPIADYTGLDKVVINDKTYTFPFKMQELLDMGLVLDEEYQGYIVNKDNTEVISVTDASGDLYLSVFAYNPTSEALAIEQCDVYGLSFYADDISNLKVSVPRGFDFTATYESVVALLGQPTSQFNGDYLTTCTWETEDMQYSVDVDFDNETNSIYSISLKNYYMY